MQVVKTLTDRGLITPPPFLKDNIHYEVMMGSVAYGASDNTSDIDVYGFAVPPKHILFPYSYGHIYNFGKPPERFDQYQQHHIKDDEARKEYDITIYNIVKYFSLVMDGNPNMIDSLFVPQRCVLSCSRIGQLVRDNRKIFLSKKLYHKFTGYAFSQICKAKTKMLKQWVEFCNKYNMDPKHSEPSMFPTDGSRERAAFIYKRIKRDGKFSHRLDSIIKHGWDVKFGYHVVRLLLETRQLLETGNMDLERDREILKSVRRGEWSLEKVENYFDENDKSLRELYDKSELPYSPNEEAVKTLLIQCLEEHYGNINRFVQYDKQALDYLYKSMEYLSRAVNLIDKDKTESNE